MVQGNVVGKDPNVVIRRPAVLREKCWEKYEIGNICIYMKLKIYEITARQEEKLQQQL